MDRTIRNHRALSSATAQLTFDFDYHAALRAPPLHVDDIAPASVTGSRGTSLTARTRRHDAVQPRAEAPQIRCSSCDTVASGRRAARAALEAMSAASEYVCARCRRKPICPLCHKRRNSLILTPYAGLRCSRCERAAAKREAKRIRRSCTECGGATTVDRTNDLGECPDCSYARLLREHPFARRPS